MLTVGGGGILELETKSKHALRKGGVRKDSMNSLAGIKLDPNKPIQDQLKEVHCPAAT